MKKSFKILMFAGIISILALTGCTTNEPQEAGYGQEDQVEYNSLDHLRIQFVGSAHETYAIVNVLQLPGEEWAVNSIQIGQDHGDFSEDHSPYTLTIFYEPHADRVIEGTREQPMIPTAVFEENSDLLFDLIENLQAITFSVRFNTADGGENSFDYRWSRSRSGEFSFETGDEDANTSQAALIEFEPAVPLESVASSNPPLAWIVQPTLEHDSIRLCNAGTFIDSERRIINPATGLLTGFFCDGHGGPPPDFVYDRDRGLFGQTRYNDAYHGGVGMHPIGEMAETIDEWTLGFVSGLIAVQAVDSSLREVFEDGLWEEWRLLDEAFLGQYAVMYNHKFVTDFIFDGAAHWWHMYRFGADLTGSRTIILDLDYIAVSRGGKWGLIGQSGNLVLDFMFDNLVMIDENTAFASYNGRYGILDVRNTVER